MPPFRWRPNTLLATTLLLGCQDTVCADLAAAYAGVGLKSQPCLERAPLPAFNPEQCEAHLQACGPKDREQLDAQIQCYQKLGTCEPGNKEVFLQDITECDGHALSNPCEAAIF
jgi:hypothetical protein